MTIKNKFPYYPTSNAKISSKPPDIKVFNNVMCTQKYDFRKITEGLSSKFTMKGGNTNLNLYNYIINPINKKKYLITSNIGKKILKNYLNHSI